MKTYYMKIKQKFIDGIISGNKKFEYCLATPERMEIKCGDIIVLISNENKNNFVKVNVESKIIYNNWEDILKNNQDDSIKLYSSEEEALNEYYKIYSKKEIDTYGIIAFKINLLKTNYSKISVLIDTNIIIKRESSNNVSFEVINLFKWFNKKSISIYIHQLSIDELSKYGDEKTKNILLKKLNSYNILPKFQNYKDVFFDEIMSKYKLNENSITDNSLLNEIYNNNIDVLLTDDNLMLQKAKELYIRDRVVASTELLKYYESTYPKNVEYKMLAVKLKYFSEIDLNSSFFNTLREDYGEINFSNWFKKKMQENCLAYVFENNDGIAGFLYLKIEDENENYLDIQPVFKPKKRLKVGTFKITETGFHLGERFLKIIFDNALKSNVKEIYVTLFENKRESVNKLKSTMEKWGFTKYGVKKTGEIVMVKNLEEYNETKDPKFNFPLIKPNKKYYFLPIFPKYHTDLFPDNILKNEDMHLYEENKAHRYALEKIYLSGSFDFKKAERGDIVLIYRNGERLPKKYSSTVTGIAIIEDIIKTKSIDECIKLCENRSIFSKDQIKKLHLKYPIVLKLIDYKSFKHKVILDDLQNYKIIDENSGPRPFKPLTENQFNIIYGLGMKDEQNN